MEMDTTPANEELPQDEVDTMKFEPSQNDDGTYYIGRREKSVALIFSHFEFLSQNINYPQNSAESHKNKLEKVLKELNFDVRYHENLTLKEILKEIESVAKEDHRERDCLLVIVLTKGEDGYLYAKDLRYKNLRIWRAFEASKAPSLIGKPKIFLFQSNEIDLSQAVTHQLLSSKRGRDDPGLLIPKLADFFIFHAPIKERNNDSMSEAEYSLFVQEFCSQLEKYASKEDLTTIMMHVSRKLSNRLRRVGVDCTPVYISTFTKLLHLSKQT